MATRNCCPSTTDATGGESSPYSTGYTPLKNTHLAMADDHNELLLTINDDGEEDSVTVDAQPTFKHGMCILLTQGSQLYK